MGRGLRLGGKGREGGEWECVDAGSAHNDADDGSQERLEDGTRDAVFVLVTNST